MQQVALNGSVVWARVEETADGLRVQFQIDDRHRLNLGHGQRIPVRVAVKDDVRGFVADVTEVLPLAMATAKGRVQHSFL
jgi:hypothetical protein